MSVLVHFAMYDSFSFIFPMTIVMIEGQVIFDDPLTDKKSERQRQRDLMKVKTWIFSTFSVLFFSLVRVKAML